MVGCGGLGCHVAAHLAMSGIGTLALFDFDTVSESNLNRQFLYAFGDIGKKKVFLAADRLRAVAPGTEIRCFDSRVVSSEDLSPAADADAVFLAVDNNAARAAVQRFCAERGLPLINGGVNGFFGTAYLYIPGRTPDLGAAGMLTAENAQTRSVSSTVGLIGALEAHLGLRLLTGDVSGAGILHVFDHGRIELLPIR